MHRPVLSRCRLGAALPVAAAALVLSVSTAAAATSAPNDPLFTQGDQWALTGALASIDAPPAWCVSTGSGVLVADVDSGADFSQPDLAGKLVRGARFTDGSGQQSSGPVDDDFGHGTMTTGIIAADTDNGTLIAGVAPSARVLVVKVLDSSGGGQPADVAAGIEWSVDHGARVVNLSIGPEIPLTGTFSSINSAVDYAWQHGAVVAIAAGNSALPASSYPQIASESLIVGALGPDAQPASYSNTSLGVNIYAPGGDSTGGNDVHHLIVSTALGGGWAAEQGTSFAAPQVAGTLADLMARGESAAQARQRILNTAVTRNGLPDLDTAAALGASGGCAAAAGTGGSGSSGHGGVAAGTPGAVLVTASASAAPASPTATPAGGVAGTSAGGGTGGSASGGITGQAARAAPAGGGIPLAAVLIAGASVLALAVALVRAGLRARRPPG